MERLAEVDLTPELVQLSREHRRGPGFLRLAQVVIDITALVLAFVLGYVARSVLPLFSQPIDPPPLTAYAPLVAMQTATLLTVFFLARLYHQRRAVSRIDVAYSVAASVSVGVVITIGLSTIFLKGTGAAGDYPRQLILYVWVFSVILVTAGRELHRQIVVRARNAGRARDRVLVVGSSPIAQAIVQQIQNNPGLGYAIVGAVNGKAGQEVAGVPVVGRPQDLPDLIDRYQVDEVIIALPDAPHADLVQLVSWCQRGRVTIKIYPDLFAYMAGGMSVDELGGLPLLSVRDVALRGWKLSLKRGLDVIGATFGLIVLSPMMIAIGTLIKLESRGPVFFLQERCGLDGRPFPMVKFRTMRSDAEKNGPAWTIKGDPRVTRMGQWLRRTNLDELPNFINVLFGDMSLVGPRPEQTHFVQKFRANIPRYMERHREKAGVTGWAQVNGMRGDTSIEDRVKYDIWYVENWSLWLDIKILIRTVVQTLLGKSKNAY